MFNINDPLFSVACIDWLAAMMLLLLPQLYVLPEKKQMFLSLSAGITLYILLFQEPFVEK